MHVFGEFVLATVVAFLPQGQTSNAAWQGRVEALIRQLGDESFAKREAATKALLAEGEKVVPLLDQARTGADLELARRIERLRYQLAGYIDDLNRLLKTFPQKEGTEIGPEAVGLVGSAQPRSGDFLLKIIADPKHQLHRPATYLFCSAWQTGSPDQLRRYLQLSFQMHVFHRPRYPQGAEALIEARYWQYLGPHGWPKSMGWKARTPVTIDGKVYGKPFESTHDGGAVTAGWVNTGKLEPGKHALRFAIEYEFTLRGEKHAGSVRSREFSFVVHPDAGDDLLAKTDRALEDRVNHELLIKEHSYVMRTGNPLRLHEETFDLWHPQVSWEADGTRHGLHVPEWSVNRPLTVDLCFDVEMRDLKTDKRYRCHPLVLHKGRTGRGLFAPDDVRAFSAGRDGFVDVELHLKPSRKAALSDPEVTSYFGGSITSIPLQAKIIGDLRGLQAVK